MFIGRRVPKDPVLFFSGAVRRHGSNAHAGQIFLRTAVHSAAAPL